MKKKKFNDELDLFDIIHHLWDNKIKILILTTVFLISGYIYYLSLNKNYLATTNIKPISNFEQQKYKFYNALAGEGGMNIDKNKLYNLFISKIQTVEIIQEGISKFKLIDKDNFKNEDEYNEEIERNAVLIIDEMNAPFINEKDKTKNKPYWQYNFEISNRLIWNNFLKYIEKKTNEEIRMSLINEFKIQTNILNNQLKFQLEDVDQNIANALDDYKNLISNKLAFLEEQAAIARTLDIAKNTLQAENFQTDNTIVTNIKSENSYYLKGYEMIEKEISLINSRKNEKAFINELFELERNKRSILQNKKNERLKLLLSETPVFNKSEFIAAKIDYITTIYKPNQSLVKILSISLIIGLLISLMYLFVFNVLASRK
tara:strand:+ start:303 stop:1424 length:1122 start_codon:yes stop_codon:yes gene_type:complete